MKVLLVEDENALADVLARNMTARGHDVTSVGSALRAVDCIVSDPPDTVVLDVNLPDESGWEVLRRIEPSRRAGLRVIVIAAAPISTKRLEEFRPERWFQKPFPLDALMRAINDTPAEEPREVS